MVSMWCEALVCWLVVVSLACSTTSTTTITPDPDTEQPLTTQQPEDEKEEGSDRFLGFGGNSFGSYDVGSSFFGSSGYQVLQQRPGRHYYPSYQPDYNSYSTGHHHNTHNNFIPNHGGIPLHPGQACKYYCLWSTHRHQYCCDNSPSYTGYLCPEVREEGCPGTNYRHSLQFCSRDRNCPYGTKCCFDACVNGHVCKTPQ